MLGKLLQDLLTHVTGTAPAEIKPSPQPEPVTNPVIILKRRDNDPPRREDHAHPKLPDKLMTEYGYPCPIDGNPLPHLHDIEWFRYPKIDAPVPHIILWKADDA